LGDQKNALRFRRIRDEKWASVETEFSIWGRTRFVLRLPK